MTAADRNCAWLWVSVLAIVVAYIAVRSTWYLGYRAGVKQAEEQYAAKVAELEQAAKPEAIKAWLNQGRNQ